MKLNYIEARTLVDKHEFHCARSLSLVPVETYRGYRLGKLGRNFYAYNGINKFKAMSIETLKRVIDADCYVYSVRVGISQSEMGTWDGK